MGSQRGSPSAPSPPRRRTPSISRDDRSRQRARLLWQHHAELGIIHQPGCDICDDFRNHVSRASLNDPDFRELDERRRRERVEELAQALARNNTNHNRDSREFSELQRDRDRLREEVDRLRSERNNYREEARRLRRHATEFDELEQMAQAAQPMEIDRSPPAARDLEHRLSEPSRTSGRVQSQAPSFMMPDEVQPSSSNVAGTTATRPSNQQRTAPPSTTVDKGKRRVPAPVSRLAQSTPSSLPPVVEDTAMTQIPPVAEEATNASPARTPSPSESLKAGVRDIYDRAMSTDWEEPRYTPEEAARRASNASIRAYHRQVRRQGERERRNRPPQPLPPWGTSDAAGSSTMYPQEPPAVVDQRSTYFNAPEYPVPDPYGPGYIPRVPPPRIQYSPPPGPQEAPDQWAPLGATPAWRADLSHEQNIALAQSRLPPPTMGLGRPFSRRRDLATFSYGGLPRAGSSRGRGVHQGYSARQEVDQMVGQIHQQDVRRAQAELGTIVPTGVMPAEFVNNNMTTAAAIDEAIAQQQIESDSPDLVTLLGHLNNVGARIPAINRHPMVAYYLRQYHGKPAWAQARWPSKFPVGKSRKVKKTTATEAPLNYGSPAEPSTVTTSQVVNTTTTEDTPMAGPSSNQTQIFSRPPPYTVDHAEDWMLYLSQDREFTVRTPGVSEDDASTVRGMLIIAELLAPEIRAQRLDEIHRELSRLPNLSLEEGTDSARARRLDRPPFQPNLEGSLEDQLTETVNFLTALTYDAQELTDIFAWCGVGQTSITGDDPMHDPSELKM